MEVPRRIYHRDEVLTPDELADALHISAEKVKAADFPCVWFGRDCRFVYGQVLDIITERARNVA